ncbi:hypothetical protein [Undibacterium rugosum]|uniref:Uncharacterized protein n=1 Tax=Undibacterium rugosum TaxID=2762291 RepID=A0A923KUN4_9BURK|nr:hypothetical protein [Undibacterium rugosum]MBC3934402.1 hypothetical protein [Undibacterium rugosum]MBR7777017.1 hypothetical protein [Undibacterium rugosum]
MESHRKLSSALHAALGVIHVVMLLGMYVFASQLFGLFSDGEIPALFTQFVGAFFILASVFCLAQIIIGFAGLAGQPWVRIPLLMIAAFEVFQFPFGTALGAYTLWAYLSEDKQQTQ